jgi:hypothetical protein
MLMFPDADVPVVQLSIQRHLDPAQHMALGAALSPLRDDGVLILGSGGAVHPLGYAAASLGEGAATDDWAHEFGGWLTDAVTRGDRVSLIKYRERGPYAERAHPYPDHFMPLLVALGAAGDEARGTVLHHSWYWGDLAMDAYEFDADRSGRAWRRLAELAFNRATSAVSKSKAALNRVSSLVSEFTSPSRCVVRNRPAADSTFQFVPHSRPLTSFGQVLFDVAGRERRARSMHYLRFCVKL